MTEVSAKDILEMARAKPLNLGGKTPIEKAILERGADLVRQGMTISQAADAVGVHRNTLGPYCRGLRQKLAIERFNKKLKEAKKKSRKHDSKIEKAQSLVRDGETVKAAAKAVGLHRNTIAPHCQEILLERRNRKRIDGQNQKASERADKAKRERQKYGTNIVDIVMQAVPTTLPQDVREEVSQELMVEVLGSSSSLQLLRNRAIALTKKINREYHNKFKMVSLDAPINEDGTTLGELMEG